MINSVQVQAIETLRVAMSPTGRTMLMSPTMVAAAAIARVITDSRELFTKTNFYYASRKNS